MSPNEGQKGPEASTRRSRSASSTTAAAAAEAAAAAATTVTPLERAERRAGRGLPPTPPSMSATTPVGGVGASFLPTATTTSYGAVGVDSDDGSVGVDIGATMPLAAGRRQGDIDLVPIPPPAPPLPHQERQQTPDRVVKPKATVLTGRPAAAAVAAKAKTKAALVDPYYGITAELAAMDGGGGVTINGSSSSRVEAAGICRHEGCRHREESLRWKLETERRDTRRRLEAMAVEVERVVGQFRTRAERAEAAAASAEKRAAVKALRYLRSKRSPSPAVPLG